MDYPKFIILNQKEDSISIQKVNVIFLSSFCLILLYYSVEYTTCRNKYSIFTP